ncbi:MAG: hydroxymethylpyrimidine/phosphomethylpyrimidine kinase [marine bacterium B5-7]|nr:MAG: hydroxymethylpyrimidine/phosphomethylpyrimidine kinase [marine bacterium B5-7]
MKTCLTIAGSDCSGGAGIQADLKTFTVFGCYGMSVITAITAQNTCGVSACYPSELACIKEQLEVIFDDIRPDSIKIGMLFSSDIISVVADFLKEHAKDIPIVLDPVMLATSGDKLLQPDAVDALKTQLLPLATLITPNLPEAVELAGKPGDPLVLGRACLALGAQAVLIKGGHDQGEEAKDVLLQKDEEPHCLSLSRLDTKNTHGTGCTLSAAIASGLARGLSLENACEVAKKYLFEALKSAQTQQIGSGCGPVNHAWCLDTTRCISAVSA